MIFSSGAVYVFVSDADRLQWNQTQLIEVVDGAEGDMFGYSISLYGANLVVGAPFHDAADVTNSGLLHNTRFLEGGLKISYTYFSCRRSVRIFQH